MASIPADLLMAIFLSSCCRTEVTNSENWPKLNCQLSIEAVLTDIFGLRFSNYLIAERLSIIPGEVGVHVLCKSFGRCVPLGH